MNKLRLILALATCSLSACSPLYVLEAGWEEAKILLSKEPIEEIINDEEFSIELKRKFQLTIEARKFAEELGLKPGGSFTEYADVERDVLVWVVSASEKTKMEPYSWWFPIVGRIPYKGYFDKEDAMEEAQALHEDGYDIYVRGSAAFSTLGWFNDPLLSTLTKFPDHYLVNTVIHEIVHNTFWFPGDASFNESLANFIGARASEQFFLQRQDTATATEAQRAWKEELLYAHYLATWIEQLEELYDSGVSEAEKLERREELFESFRKDWDAQASKKEFELNNARILAQRVYLDRLWIFEEGFSHCDENLACVIAPLQELASKEGQDSPFLEFQRLTQEYQFLE